MSVYSPIFNMCRAVIFTLVSIAVALLSLPAQAQSKSIPQPTPCPRFLGATTQCFGGQSDAGALYILAKPQNWNGRLILFAHGGPRLGAPKLEETIEDLEKFQFLVREGYAWAGTTYRRGGFGVRSAAADMDELRTIMWGHLGKPKLTLLHGQSWGGNVAAKASELYAIDLEGRRNFDGVVLTSAVLSGGTRAYQMRADLRAVYQYYCQNHPKPSEPAYPLWSGLPSGATMSRADIAERVKACTGIGLPVAQRTAKQAENLRNITRVLKLPEDQIVPNLVWATNTFQDLVSRLGGRNPFANTQSLYSGSTNNRALNSRVVRFSADPQALAELGYDSDLSGLIVLPTISLHGIGDMVARVCHQSAYRQTLESVGRGSLLVQTYTSEAEHSRLASPAYSASFQALADWIEAGGRPNAAHIKQACSNLAEAHGEPCKMILPANIPSWPC